MEKLSRRDFLSSAAAAAAGAGLLGGKAVQTTAQALALTGADKSNAAELNARLLKFADELRKGQLTTLAPLLPLLLNLRGKPYTLANHFPFEPFFKVRMPQRIVLCTGRQVSKSTSLAAQSIVLANCIPHFNTLFVTPQYELTRRFSNNYVRQFIDQSPVKRLWCDSNTENSVLQRSFRNSAKLIFSFALLDADRTRGVPADKIVYDESVRYGTLVETPLGDVPIEDLLPGDQIYAIDEDGCLQLDEVVANSDHGVRDCYRFEFSDGSSVEATSDSFLATTAGWRRVSSVIADAAAGAALAGDDAGRREHGDAENGSGQSAVSQSTFVQTARLQHGEVPGLIRVREHPSQETEELRLRGLVERLANTELPGATPYRFLVSPGRQEAGDASLARQADLGRRRLVVSGRRWNGRRQHGDLQYARLPARGSRTPGFLADATGYRRYGQESPASLGAGLVLGRAADGRFDLQTGRVDSSVRRAGDAVQAATAGAIDVVDLPLVRHGVHSQTKPGQVRAHAESLLRFAGMQEGAARAPQRTPDVRPGETGRQERAATGTLSERPDGTREESAQAGRTPCGVADLVRVTWTGKHRVRDIQTKYHRTFFAGGVAVHNCQDMDPDFIPIINETVSASGWKLEQYAGTPKTLDGTLETKWQDSSMAEWLIKCTACGHWNIPGLDHDMLDMIGPDLDDVSESNPGVVCARCNRKGIRTPLNPRTGRWVHAKPELMYEFAGYHVPQMIMPMHYADPKAWRILCGKRRGLHNTPLHVFYNECCGESFDFGAKLVTQTDMQNAAKGLHDNTAANAMAVRDRYIACLLAVDWGGGGEEEVSFTTVAVLGMLPNGNIDVIFGDRSLTPHDPLVEARLILKYMGMFRCSHIVHDYSGAGSLREQFLANAGIPYQRLVPIAYVRAASGPIMRQIDATHLHPRSYYRVDKTRSLLLTCNQLRTGKLRFFNYDHRGAGQPGLLHDFLALIEDKASTRHGSDSYTIIRKPKHSDDFAQAVNIGCCGLWELTKRWPNVAELSGIAAPPEAREATRDRYFDLGLGDD